MTYKTLSNALELLGYFTAETPAWGVRELAKASGMHSAVVHRTLATFAESGFLVQDMVSRKYMLGVRVYELGVTFRERLHITDIIAPGMRELAMQTGETAFTTYLDGIEGVCIDIAESPNSLKYSVSLGSRFPLHAGANAKAILAYLPQEDIDNILAGPLVALGANTECDPNVIRKQLQEIRSRRWCYTEEEYSAETFGLACPLLIRGEVIASIGIAGPITRIDEKGKDMLVDMVSRKTREIQVELEKIF